MSSGERFVRRLAQDDAVDAAALGAEAFGELPAGSPDPARTPFPRAGRHEWGAFDGGHLVARMAAREYRSWWGGHDLATCGIASVAVTAEHRGRGLVADLFGAALPDAVERGDVVATLFATAPGIYRGFGFELVSSLDDVELATRDLTAVRPARGVVTRRAEPADVPAVRALWDRWAAAQNGPLTRRGPSFPGTDAELLGGVTRLSLAVRADDERDVLGWVAWRRGHGYDEAACLEVDDLVAVDAEAHRALWRLLGSFSSVAARVRVTTSGDDPARLVLPTDRWPLVTRHPYMLRLLDVPAALAVVPGATAPHEVGFAVTGDVVAGTDGAYRVTRGTAGTTTQRVDAVDGLPTLTPGGLALLWSGAQTAANLRWTGHLSGPADQDDALDGLALRRPRHVRDYF